MASKPFFTIRNLGISTFYLSLLTGGLLALASLERVNVPVGFTEDGQYFQVESRPTSNKPLYSIGSLLSLAIAGAHISAKIGEKDLIDFDNIGPDTADTLEKLIKMGITLAGDLIGEGLSFLLVTGKHSGKQLAQLAITSAPLPVRTAFERMVDDKTWFEKFSKAPHRRIAGRTRSGKRYIASQMLIDYVADHPNGQVVICDKDFGKDGNDWMGVPLECIHSNLETIDAAVATVYETLLWRAKTCETAARERRSLTPAEKAKVQTPILLVVDELDSTNGDFLHQKNDRFIYHLRELLKRGGGCKSGYFISVLLIGQSLSVGSKERSGSGIDLALTDQMATVLTVGVGQLNTKQLANLQAEVGDEIAEKALALTSKGVRAAVALLDGIPQVVAIPDLSHLETFRFSQVNPDDIWWQQTYTPEVQVWLKDLAIRFSSGEIPSPLKTEIVPRFGVKLLSTDARYTKYVKTEWERLLTEFKEQTTNEH